MGSQETNQDFSLYVAKPVKFLVRSAEEPKFEDRIPNLKYDLITGHLINSINNQVVSSDHKHLTNCNISLKFDIGTIDLKNGEKVEMKGEFPFLGTWRMGTDYAHSPLVLQSDEDKAIATFKQFMIQYGIAKEGEEFFKKQLKTSSYIIARNMAVPGLSYEELFPITIYSLFAFFTDDIFDGKELQDKELSQNHIIQAFNILCDVLNGLPIDQTLIKENHVPKLGKLCPIFAYFRKLLIAAERYSGEADLAIFHSIRWYQSVSWEHCNWTFGPGIEPQDNINSFLVIAGHTVGMKPTIEVFALLHHVDVDNKIRSDPLFDHFDNLCSQYGRLMNDLFSFRKEIENENEAKMNYIMVMKSNFEGIQACVDNLIQSVIPKYKMEIHSAKAQLLRKFPGNKGLKRYIEIWYSALDAGPGFHFYAERYNLGLDKAEIVFTKTK